MVAFFAALDARARRPLSPRSTRGLRPCGSAAYGKYLYVDNYGAGTILAHQPGDEQGRQAPQSRADSLRCRRWAAARSGSRTSSRRKIVRVDPVRLKITKRIRVGKLAVDVGDVFGSVWSSNQTDGTVSRIDPKRNKVVKTIHHGR